MSGKGGGNGAPQVSLRRARPEERDAILQLRERATGTRPDPDVWDWLFTANPASSEFYSCVAESEGRLVGQQAAFSVRLQHAGRQILSLTTVNVVTDPAFRGRGLSSGLGRMLQEEVAHERPVNRGFPNTASAPIFYGPKLGWVELRPFPLFVRPLGNVRKMASARPRLSVVAPFADALAPIGLAPAYAAERLAERKGARVAALDDFGPWADDLWEGLQGQLGTCAVRDAAFLRWRFCASPFRPNYRIFALHRDSEPVGFAVLSLREGKVADLMELMVPVEDHAGARALLGHVVREAWSSGAGAIRAYVSRRHPHRAEFMKLGFVPMPARLKSDYSFGVGVLDPSQVLPNALLHANDWYISGSDLDFK